MEDYNLEEAAKQYRDEFLDKNDNDISKYDIEDIFIDGAKWQIEQYKKAELKYCATLTTEEAEREINFVNSFINNEYRVPTFSDAIEYGRESMREKLTKLKELADKMYYAAQYLTTDASKLRKAMRDYWHYVIYGLKEE